jgi:hypothetical protein
MPLKADVPDDEGNVRFVPISLRKSATTAARVADEGFLMAWCAILLHRKRTIASVAPGLRRTYAKYSCAAGGGRTKSLASRLRF